MINLHEINQTFTKDALTILDRRLEESADPVTFLHAVDEIASDPAYTLQLPFSINLEAPLLVEADGTSAQTLYEAIGGWSAADAADPRLWSYLALVPLRDYMMQRWGMEKDGKDFRTRVRSRWMLQRPEARGLIRNGISRLWWVAKLTHDPFFAHPLSAASSDPFAYTKWTFEKQNRVQNIFERQIGNSPDLMWAVIESLADDAADPSKDTSKTFLKDVHLAAGYQRLEVLPFGDLKTRITGEVNA